MDDFNLSTLRGSRDEWCIRLINILTPQIIKGIRSIFSTSYSQCVEINETNKYLVTFQNYLTRIPKWNAELIEQECNRIVEDSGCAYLDDLITCVHIIQLKMLTCVRVGTKQKKVDLDIPKVEIFIHKVYIHVARELYTKVYLFMLDATPIEKQKNNHMIEQIIQSCIFNAVGESMPDKKILRAFLDETEETVEEVKEEIIKETITPIKEEKPKPKRRLSGAGVGGVASTITDSMSGNISSQKMDSHEIDEPMVAVKKAPSAFTALPGSPVLSLQGNDESNSVSAIEEINLSGGVNEVLDVGNAISLNFGDDIIELN